MMLFFLLHDCKSTFCPGWGQKNNDVAIFCIVLYKTMQTFDIMLKKMHRRSVNRFDGDIFLVRFDY